MFNPLGDSFDGSAFSPSRVVKVTFFNYIYGLDRVSSMPIVRVLMYGGRSQQQKDDLARAITDAVESIAKAPRDQTIVVFQEVAKEHYYIGAKRAS